MRKTIGRAAELAAGHPYVRWDHCDDCFATFERVSNGGHVDKWVDEMERRWAE